MHEWSPETHSLTGSRTNIIVEPAIGGRWYETGANGTEVDWGKVLAWNPPHRMLLAWQLNANFSFDPGQITDVEIRFEPVGSNATRVEFEHRNLDRYGATAPEIFQILDGDNGWGGSLQNYADLVEGKRVK
jgi:uncharacterized protein YndB with AHSA1/START domain